MFESHNQDTLPCFAILLKLPKNGKIEKVLNHQKEFLLTFIFQPENLQHLIDWKTEIISLVLQKKNLANMKENMMTES